MNALEARANGDTAWAKKDTIERILRWKKIYLKTRFSLIMIPIQNFLNMVFLFFVEPHLVLLLDNFIWSLLPEKI